MTSIVPYVTDDAGVFDAHKTKRMIDELVKDMNQYANQTLLWCGDIQKYAGNVWFKNVLDYGCLVYENVLI